MSNSRKQTKTLGAVKRLSGVYSGPARPIPGIYSGPARRLQRLKSGSSKNAAVLKIPVEIITKEYKFPEPKERVSLMKMSSVQVKNPATGHYIKRNTRTGRFEIKTDGKPFKGVPRKNIVLAAPNPALDPETARLGEEAVIRYFNQQAERE